MLVMVGLAACAGTPEPGSPESRAAYVEKERVLTSEAMKITQENVPDWYGAKVTRSDLALYGSGMAKSSSLQMAVNIATAHAKVQLATAMGSEISSRLEIDNTSVSEDVIEESIQVITDAAVKIRLVGAEVKERRLLVERGKHVVFVLLELPIGEANRIQLDIINKAKRIVAKEKSGKVRDSLNKAMDGASKNIAL